MPIRRLALATSFRLLRLSGKLNGHVSHFLHEAGRESSRSDFSDSGGCTEGKRQEVEPRGTYPYVSSEPLSTTDLFHYCHTQTNASIPARIKVITSIAPTLRLIHNGGVLYR